MKQKSQIMKSNKRNREFEKEVLQHSSEFFKQAMLLTKDPEDAADLLQESLLRAYDAWDSFELGTSGRRWLHRILRNSFYSRCRRVRREKRWLADRSGVVDSLHYGGIRRSRKTPEAKIAERGLTEEVDSALSCLPGEFRSVLELYCVEGLSYKEIATLIGCPVGTVMSRIHRARRRLKKIIEEKLLKKSGKTADQKEGFSQLIDTFLVAA